MSYRILHVLDHSWPVLDGYSHRSRSIVSSQKSMGLEPAVLTGPLHNVDDQKAADTELDDIRYLRTPTHSGILWQAIRSRWPLLREAAVVHLLEKRIGSLLARQDIDIVHAHSPALCGLAASRAARARHLPFVYEIRSFWEDGTFQSPSSLKYRLSRALETHLVMRAHAIVGITEPMLKDLASRGAPESRLFSVPNGVDSARFTPRARDGELEAQLGIHGVPTLGFLGTLFPWEGVTWLVQAAARLRSKGFGFKLLIVGDGAERESICRAISAENAQDFVSYLGRVAPEDVERYYSVMDILAYPRLSMRITELVTPLKPLEAMALGKPVLGSGVGGIRELIDPEVTGLLFEPGNAEDFCDQALRLLKDSDLRQALGKRARTKTCEERDWKTVVSRYARVYEAAIHNFREHS